MSFLRPSQLHPLFFRTFVMTEKRNGFSSKIGGGKLGACFWSQKKMRGGHCPTKSPHVTTCHHMSPPTIDANWQLFKKQRPPDSAALPGRRRAELSWIPGFQGQQTSWKSLNIKDFLTVHPSEWRIIQNPKSWHPSYPPVIWDTQPKDRSSFISILDCLSAVTTSSFCHLQAIQWNQRWDPHSEWDGHKEKRQQ